MQGSILWRRVIQFQIKWAALSCLLMFDIAPSLGQTVLTTSGTEFWLGYMNNYLPGPEHTMAVFISSDQPTSGVVEMPLLGWSQSFTTAIGVTTIIDLPQTANNNESAVVSNRGVHITSVAPINVYALNYKNNSSDATRILPKTFLDIDYFVHGYGGQSNIIDTLRSELLIVATEDDSELEITPACDMLGGPLQGVPFTIQMDRGETYLLKALFLEDVSGTTISGTEASGECRPFAVFGGSECSFVPQLCSPCDNLFDQMVPSSVWGTEYFLGNFDTWVSSYTFRATATQNGTQLFIDGVASGNLDAGEFLEFNALEDPIYISSNFPIGVIQYMEGGGCTVSGDPSMMTANSLFQTMNQVTFATLNSPFINEHHVQIIVPTNAISIVFLDGIPVPASSFTPFAGNTTFSIADIEVPIGSHQLTCQQGFIANAYGVGNAESYLYSTGANAQQTEELPNVICSISEVILQTDENYTNIWWSTFEDPETEIFNGQPFVISPPIANQMYILHGDNFLSGCPEEEMFSVESPNPLTVNIVQSTVDLCLLEQFTFDATVSPAGSSYEYQWSESGAFSVDNIANGVIAPYQSGWYYLDVSSFSGCALGRDSVLVNITNDDVTTIHAWADPLAICEGETVNLEAQTGFNAGVEFFNAGVLSNTLWEEMTGGTIGNNCASIGGSSLFFAGNGNRWLESENFDMSAGGTIQFQIQISDGSQGCDGAEPGEDVFLQYSTNGGGAWTTMLTLFENDYPAFTPLEVVVPDAAQTSATRFRWWQPQSSGANQDIWWLDNIIFSTFEPNSGVITWDANATVTNASSAMASSQPVEDMYYYLETTVNGCTFTDSVFVEVQPAFDLIISNDTSVCGPFPVPLSVTSTVPGFYTYQWSNPTLMSTPDAPNTTATATQDTEFTVTVTSSNGCTSTASTMVDLISSIPPVITPQTATICSVPHQLQVVVDGNPANYSFEWTANDILDVTNTQVVNASPAGGSFQTVEVTVTNNVTGCVYTDTQNLSALFAEFDLPSDTVICDSEGFVVQYEITNSQFNAIAWTHPGVLSSNTTAFPTITVPNFNGDLIVTMFVPGNGGCSVSDTITIITQDLQYSAPDVLSICHNETAQASISGDFSSITWTPSPNLDTTDPTQPLFSNTAPEVFYFSLDANGSCAISDSLEVLFNLPASFEIIAQAPFCEGNPIVLSNPLDNQIYAWSNGSTTQNLTVFTGGTYAVQVTDSAGCSVMDDIIIETLATTPFEIIGDTTACNGETITLFADIVSDNYLWSNNASTQSSDYALSGSQIVWAEVIDENNCFYRDSIVIVFADPVALQLLSAGAICDNIPTQLTAVVADANTTTIWSTGETSASISVDVPGTYTVQATDANGCERSETIDIAQVNFPQLSMDTSYCQGGSVVIDPNVSNAFEFTWSNGTDSSSVTINQPGSYNLTLSQLNCERDIVFSVVEWPLPSLEIITDGPFCSLEFGTQGYLVVANSDGQVQWENNAAISNNLLVTQPGYYTATATNIFGCSNEMTIGIAEECPEPTLYAPNSFTPNDDGINDYWGVAFEGEFHTFSLVIFDRNGQRIFNTNNASEFWTGEVLGGEFYAMDGIYNYILNYSLKNEDAAVSTKRLRGHITLIR